MRGIPLKLLLAALLVSSCANAQSVRDPMRPAGAAPAARPSGPAALRLEGIIAGAVRVAIVNGSVVAPGDSIAGARILEVMADGVRYSRGGRIQTLVLPGIRPATVRVARSPEATKP
jgi:hypothetical protein